MSPELASSPEAVLTKADPALGGLRECLDPDAVAGRFERRWPGPGPPPSVMACRLHRVRWVPGVECVATYRLTVMSSVGHPASTFGVVTVNPDGDELGLFSDDEQLPGLSAAADPIVMNRWLSERMGRFAHSCSITPVSYRPGEGCVLRYELSSPASMVVYGKVLAGDRACHLAATVRSLGESVAPSLVGVAPQWQLVVLTDAGSRTVGSILSDTPSPEGLAAVRACAALLSCLHARPGPPGALRSLADDVADLEQYLPPAQRAAPVSAARLADGIGRLRELVERDGRAGPSHGALRLDHAHLGANGPRFIDLDSYCWAERERDVSNLVAYLRWRLIRRPDQRVAVARIRGAFLASYEDEAGTPLDERRLVVSEAASMLKIAGRRYRSLAVAEWDRTPDLIDAALEQLRFADRGTP